MFRLTWLPESPATTFPEGLVHPRKRLFPEQVSSCSPKSLSFRLPSGYSVLTAQVLTCTQLCTADRARKAWQPLASLTS